MTLPSRIIALATACVACCSASAATTPERTEIPESAKWDLARMYASTQAWQDHYAQMEGRIRAFAERKGSLGKSPEALLAALKDREQIVVNLEKIEAYARMRLDEDMRKSDTQAMFQRAQTLSLKWEEASSWFLPEMLSIPEDRLRGWLQRPDLKIYTHFIGEILRIKPHVLSPREEELLAMSGKATEASSTTFGLLSNTELRWRTVKDSEGRDIEITSSSFIQAMNSKDRRYRRDAFVALHESFQDVQNTLSSTLAGIMERDWYLAKARGYPTSLDRALDAENLPKSVYTNLLGTIDKRRQLLHRYVSLKKKVLKVDQVHFYDLYLNLVDVPERDYPYDEAKKMVLGGVKPFGAEYLEVMRTALEDRWIDVYENKGKRSGAYNMGTYLSLPYVLLNYQGTFKDVSTLAHELGHAMQSWFAKENQPPVYAGYPMFTAEVASTAAEIVFKQSILDSIKEPKEKAFLINQMLEDMRGTVFRQTQFAEADLAIHTLAEKGQPITAEVCRKLCRDHYQRYYGPDFAMDPELEVEYLRIPHFYRSYYVYRYANSYCAAAAIAKRIHAGDTQAREQWMQFLKTGNSMYAIDMLKVAGVDMTTPKPIEDAMDLFDQLLTELEHLL